MSKNFGVKGMNTPIGDKDLKRMLNLMIFDNFRVVTKIHALDILFIVFRYVEKDYDTASKIGVSKIKNLKDGF